MTHLLFVIAKGKLQSHKGCHVHLANLAWQIAYGNDKGGSNR